MLSAAKHLLYLLESKQKQILRFAQNDVLRAFFSILLGTKLRFVPGKMVTAETPSRVEMNALAGALDRVSAACAVVYSLSC
jgi:hypothetical protein